MLQYFNHTVFELDKEDWLQGIRENWLAVDPKEGIHLMREQQLIDFIHRDIPCADDAGTWVYKLVRPDADEPHYFRAGTNDEALRYANEYVVAERQKVMMKKTIIIDDYNHLPAEKQAALLEWYERIVRRFPEGAVVYSACLTWEEGGEQHQVDLPPETIAQIQPMSVGV